MATDYGEDVRTWLLSISGVSSAVSTRCHENHVPDDKDGPYIWYRHGGIQPDDCLDDSAGTEPLNVSYDIEICGDDLGQVATIAKAIRNATPMRGTFGASTVKGVFVDNHDEDYLYQNQYADEVRHLQSLQLTIFG